jgi:predicted aspartyl protease
MRGPAFVAGVGIAAAVLGGCGGGAAKLAVTPHAVRQVSAPLLEYRRDDAVKAFVRLTLNEHPYYFVVDTGAAGTIIDTPVAKALGLRDNGAARDFFAIGCRISSPPVALRGWRLGAVALPPGTAFTQPLELPRDIAGVPVAGLLGSAFFARFGSVTIDFARRRLVLGARTLAGGTTVAVNVIRRAGLVEVATQVVLNGHRARLLVDTGAPYSLIDASTASQLRLPVEGPSAVLTGAVAGCHAASPPVRVRRWTVAGVQIAGAIISRVNGLLPRRYLRLGIVGFLGTSTLSRRATLTINYADATMNLGGTLP